MPSEAHEARVLLLRSLARLVGCVESIGDSLPDGSRPDVLAVRRPDRSLFIGEAKESESPRDQAAILRLRRYMQWAKLSSGSTAGVFAVCAPSSGPDWLDLLVNLADEHSLTPSRPSLSELGSRDLVATVCWDRAVTHLADARAARAASFTPRSPAEELRQRGAMTRPLRAPLPRSRRGRYLTHPLRVEDRRGPAFDPRD